MSESSDRDGSGFVVTVIRGNTSEVTRSFELGRPSSPLAVGSQGDWVVSAPGVVATHFWLSFDGHSLHAKSADATASFQGKVLDQNWSPIPEQGELRFGFALMRVGPRHPGRASASSSSGTRNRRVWARYLALGSLLLASLLLALAALSRREAKPPVVAVSPVASPAPAAPPAPAGSAEQNQRAPTRVGGERLSPPPALAGDDWGAPPSAPSSSESVLAIAPSAPRAYRQDIADRPVPRIGARPDQISEEWLAHHQRQLRAGNRSTAKVIFLGDSITEGWGASSAYRDYFGKYSPLNLGIAGDLTQNVLWRIQEGALDGTKPQAVVVMVGINNLAGGFSPERTAGGVRAIIGGVRSHLPAARVLLLSILPARQEPANPLRQRVLETNRLLANLAEPGFVDVEDFGSLLLEPDGTISKTILRDFVHPTAAGYQRLSQAVAPLLDARTSSAPN